MSKLYTIGCLHLGHEGMAAFRGYSSAEDYFQELKKRWNSVLTKRDLVYILGDVTMESKKHYHLLDQLNGQKTVVLGNHDMPNHVPEMLKHVNKVAGLVKLRRNVGKKVNLMLSHAPIDINELVRSKAFNIHAHIHHLNPVPSPYHINVDAHVIGLVPLLIDRIAQDFSSLKDKYVELAFITSIKEKERK